MTRTENPASSRIAPRADVNLSPGRGQVSPAIILRSRSESFRFEDSSPMPKREMAKGVTDEVLTGASRGNGGARLAVTRADAGALEGVSSGRAAAAQRIGAAEGSGDGSSVRSDWCRHG